MKDFFEDEYEGLKNSEKKVVVKKKSKKKIKILVINEKPRNV